MDGYANRMTDPSAVMAGLTWGVSISIQLTALLMSPTLFSNYLVFSMCHSLNFKCSPMDPMVTVRSLGWHYRR